MNRIGDLSQADFESMRLAEQMQALSMEYINEAFFAEEDLNINNLTWNRFMDAVDRAKDGGPVAQNELDQMLLKILQPIAQQVMNPPQPGAQGQQAQGGS